MALMSRCPPITWFSSSSFSSSQTKPAQPAGEKAMQTKITSTKRETQFRPYEKGTGVSAMPQTLIGTWAKLDLKVSYTMAIMKLLALFLLTTLVGIARAATPAGLHAFHK